MSSWVPTHVQVTVHRARNLISKGKGGTNNAFVTMQLGKEKFQTSVAREQRDAEWGEECELTLYGMDGVIVLNAYHKSTLVEEFLGRLDLPLSKFNRYDPPRCEWYKLMSKPGKVKLKERGELEVEVGFIAKAKENDIVTENKKISKKLLRSVTEAVGAVRSSVHLKTRSNSFGSSQTTTSNINISVEDILKEMGEDDNVDDDNASTPSRASGSLTQLEHSGSYSGGSPRQQEKQQPSGIFSGRKRRSSSGSPIPNRTLLRSSSFRDNEQSEKTASDNPAAANGTVPQQETKPAIQNDKGKRRHSIHAVTGSILNFAASKLRGDQSLKHSISEETADEYESLNRQELLKVAIQLRQQLKQKETELAKRQSYIDNLLLLVMEKAPHLLEHAELQGASDSPKLNTKNGVHAKSARKRPT